MTNEPRFLIWGPWARSELWVAPEWEGRPELGPWLTEDGRRITEVIAEGKADTLGFPVWFEQSQNCRDTKWPRSDMLWNEGSPAKVVSERFVQTLTDLGATGFSAYPVEVRTRKGEAVEGYVGLVSDTTGTTDVTTPGWEDGLQSFGVLVTEKILAGLLEAGLRIDWEPDEPDED